MSKPILLDLFCGGGGAGEGYHRAGFEVIGVDNKEHLNYPYEFIQDDALSFLSKFAGDFDAFHASPPCQKFSCSTPFNRKNGKEYPNLIPPVRLALEKTGKPCIIENVSKAPIRGDIILYGYMFGLKVIRKRKFELINWWMMQPGKIIKPGMVMNGDFVTPIGVAKWVTTNWNDKRGSERMKEMIKFKKETAVKTWMYAMGYQKNRKISDVEISESIPPAYTHYIGEELMRQYFTKP